jgi:hypothetical protein
MNARKCFLSLFLAGAGLYASSAGRYGSVDDDQRLGDNGKAGTISGSSDVLLGASVPLGSLSANGDLTSAPLSGIVATGGAQLAPIAYHERVDGVVHPIHDQEPQQQGEVGVLGNDDGGLHHALRHITVRGITSKQATGYAADAVSNASSAVQQSISSALIAMGARTLSGSVSGSSSLEDLAAAAQSSKGNRMTFARHGDDEYSHPETEGA